MTHRDTGLQNKLFFFSLITDCYVGREKFDKISLPLCVCVFFHLFLSFSSPDRVCNPNGEDFKSCFLNIKNFVYCWLCHSVLIKGISTNQSCSVGSISKGSG